MSIKFAKSNGLLYQLNHFVPETILKMLYTSIFIHTYHMVEKHGMEDIKIIPEQFSFLQEKAIHAINNLAQNKHTKYQHILQM